MMIKMFSLFAFVLGLGFFWSLEGAHQSAGDQEDTDAVLQALLENATAHNSD